MPGWDSIGSPHLICALITLLLLGAATIGLLLHTTGVGAHLARTAVPTAQRS
ncbi:MAG: hypothetical protein WCF04_09850 [Candidatus Nanopelagicales bacterium]